MLLSSEDLDHVNGDLERSTCILRFLQPEDQDWDPVTAITNRAGEVNHVC